MRRRSAPLIVSKFGSNKLDLPIGESGTRLGSVTDGCVECRARGGRPVSGRLRPRSRDSAFRALDPRVRCLGTARGPLGWARRPGLSLRHFSAAVLSRNELAAAEIEISFASQGKRATLLPLTIV